jgi:hypothetical protein
MWMNKNQFLASIIFLMIASVILSACNYNVVPTVSEEELSMQFAGTRSAIATQSSIETLVVRLEELSNQPECPVCATCPPPETPTPVVPTATVTPAEQGGLPAAAITPIGDQYNANCLNFDFLGDVNYPPDTRVKPGATFSKSWWVRNSGTCTWTLQFRLVHSGAEKFGSTGEIGFSQTVQPGETVQLSAPNLVAPSETGTYYSYWMIESPYGNRFGYGQDQLMGLGIKIVVAIN